MGLPRRPCVRSRRCAPGPPTSPRRCLTSACLCRHGRRDRPPRANLQRDARPARRGNRARAHLRRRRQPRVAHAAGDPPHRAGAGPGRGSLAGGAAGGAGLGGRGDRSAQPALRRPADDRPDRARRAAAAADPDRSRRDLRRSRQRFGGGPSEAGRSIEVEETGLAVIADRLRLDQAIGNLVDNSLRYGAGPITWAHPSATEVEIHVSDRGPGFAPEFLERAFERFSRRSPIAATAAVGSGWRSSAPSLAPTAARRTRATARAVAQTSGWRCLAGPPERSSLLKLLGLSWPFSSSSHLRRRRSGSNPRKGKS